MAARANSLALGYSGVRPEIAELLCRMVNADVVPVVPLRGSVSASGDLAPTSYIAAAMSGRSDAKVTVGGFGGGSNGQYVKVVTVVEAFEAAGLTFVEFAAKEALAVVNASSFGASLAAVVLFDAAMAAVIAQLVTALAVECLDGRLESFHQIVHDRCLPHAGNRLVAANVRRLLSGSRLVRAVHEWRRPDVAHELKQDRYALRTAPQWLGPTVETLTESVRRLNVELNSANDNPLIDHRTGEMLHCGNFQGLSITVAMDQVELVTFVTYHGKNLHTVFDYRLRSNT